MYTCTHKQKGRNNYYRLRMADTDGRFTYSPVVKVMIHAGTLSVNLFSNPVTDILQINLQAKKIDHAV
jgi:hypothetical protein